MKELFRTFGLSTDLKDFTQVLERAFCVALSRHIDIVCVCVGTSKMHGDSFGAIVGDMLLDLRLPIWVYGSSLSNVDARNISATMQVINLVHSHSFVLVIDAMSTLDPTTVGDLVITDSYVGLNQNVSIFADLYVYGVTTYLSHAKRNLHSQLSLTDTLAHNLCHAISTACANAQHRMQLKFLDKFVLK